MARHAQAWLHELEELMAWLGWVDQWTGCEKGCAANVSRVIEPVFLNPLCPKRKNLLIYQTGGLLYSYVARR
jgi:hypothetical protein